MGIVDEKLRNKHFHGQIIDRDRDERVEVMAKRVLLSNFLRANLKEVSCGVVAIQTMHTATWLMPQVGHIKAIVTRLGKKVW